MLAALGACPLIPTSVTCQNGLQAVQEMDSVFSTAPAAIQARFQSAHDTIMSQYQSYSWYTCYVELYNGEVCALGEQATALMNQIQSALGQSGTPSPSSGGFDLSSLVGLPGLLIGGVVLFLVLERKL
jgi:hypothetical protein